MSGKTDPAQASVPSRHSALLYAAVIGAAIGLFFVIRHFGEMLSTSASVAPDTPAAALHTKPNILLHVLLGLGAILLVGRVMGLLFAYFRQPPVIGEVIAGILLGPSLLGHVAPDATAFLFPPAAIPFLGVLAQIGVILYMFLVGLDLNTALLRRHAHATALISHTSIVVPFVLGALTALALFRPLAPAGVPFTSFALFLGVALAVTAFPVLARILTDHDMQRTPLGVLALSCAAIDDATAWCLLALVIGVAQGNLIGAGQVIALTLVFLAFMLIIARPLINRLTAWYEAPRQGDLEGSPAPQRRLLPWVFVALVLCALATEAIAIHALFGAFLLGALIPHDSRLARDLAAQLEHVATGFLLPAFFAYTGLRTEIGLVSGWENWLFCGLIIVAASVGKFGGSYVAARWTGLDMRTSLALGALMNTRGLMGLIVLNIGLDLGVISATLFAMMVLMALVTTLTTAPLLEWLVPKGEPAAVEYS